MSELTELLAAVIRGDAVAAGKLADIEPEVVRQAADRHGVLSLVAYRLARLRLSRQTVVALLAEEARRRAAADLFRTHELRMCLDALARADVPVLLMKGAELAYTHYERPDLRPRGDTDMLIPVEARQRIGDALVGCGYRPVRQLPGDLVMYQATYTKPCNGAAGHIVDVHWRAANPQVFGGVLTYEQLAKNAVGVPGLGPHARGLSSPDALVLACVHRVAHHFDTDYLIWLYDVHLLASCLDRSDWTHAVQLACQRGVATVCASGLRRAAQAFHTDIPVDVLSQLDAASQGAGEAATAAYLVHRRRHVENVFADLRAVPTWTSRWRLVREHLFPPRQYMRDVYAPLNGLRAVPLALLYVQRVVSGARKWLGRAT
jgi:hypothetical protein